MCDFCGFGHREETPRSPPATSGCAPRSTNATPDPATRSVTVRDTSTSPGRERAYGARALERHAATRPSGVTIALAGVQAERSAAAEARAGAGKARAHAMAACRAVEGGEEPIRRERQAAAPEPGDLLLHVRLEGRRSLRRRHVALSMRAHSTVASTRSGRFPLAADVQERRDLVEHRVLIADKRQMIVARQLDELRARNQARHVAAFLDQQAAIAGAVQHQRRHADERQHVADVDLGVHLRQRDRRAGLAPMPQVRRPPFAERRIGGAARRPLLDPDRPAPVRRRSPRRTLRAPPASAPTDSRAPTAASRRCRS